MPRPNHPSSLTPDQRRDEIALILARGFTRARSAIADRQSLASPDTYPQSQNPLDLKAKTRPHGAKGSGG